MKHPNKLAYVLFPNRCLFCYEVIGWNEHVCRRCRQNPPSMLPPLCPYCGRSESVCICGGRQRHYARCVTPLPYSERLRDAVGRLKETGCNTTADGFAAEMEEVLRREYRKATCQIALCDGGFGASPNSRGSACHCVNLYTGKSTRYERSDVLGVLEGNQIPKWAQQGLKRHQQEQQTNKTQRSSER